MSNKKLNTNVGLLMTRGMKFVIPSGGLKVSFDKGVELVDYKVEIELFHIWLEIAFNHLISSEKARKKVLILNQTNDNKMGLHIESEFSSGMQSIMASAIAIDAIYASIKKLVTIPSNQLEAWKKNKTARYIQVTETLRIAFKLNNDNTRKVRKVLKEIYKFRDWAVHPPNDQRKPILDNELNKLVEWRFVAFNYANAKECLRLMLRLIYQLLNKSNLSNKKIMKYCEESLKLFQPVKKKWERKFEKLPS